MKICPACTRAYPATAERCEQDGAALVAMATGAGAKPEELCGQTVDGRYRVERVIGRGGMGTVYACRHVVVGKAVAMKVLRPGVERSEGVLQRFIREAQLANAIRSRHIVEMMDFGQLPDGCFYVVMELCEGEDLTRAMRGGRLGRRELVHVFIQIAEALSLAHGRGIIHRDLKPDNVFLVREEGQPNFVKLLDFGIAKVMHGDNSGLTETGVILGTPYYMSPEQARAERVDHRTDIYALGVIMYRAFTGRLPFLADSAMGVLTRHVTEAPELPSRITDVDVETERLILRCLEKAPSQRFQTMTDVATALRALLSPGPRALRDPKAVEARGRALTEDPTSGAYAALPGTSGPYAAMPAMSGPYAAAPARRPYAAPVQPAGGGEPTSPGLATSGAYAAAPPKRSPALLAVGALAMLAVGAAGAVGMFGRGSPEHAPGAGEASAASAASSPAEVSAASPPAEVSAASPPAEAPPAPDVPPAAAPQDAPSALSAASAAPSASAAATAPPARNTATGAAPRPAATPAAAPTAAPTATTRRAPEIRSPFE